MRPITSSRKVFLNGATSQAKTSADCSGTRNMRNRSPRGASVRISVVFSRRNAWRTAWARRAHPPPRRPPPPPLRPRRGALDARPHAVLDHQPAGGDQRGDLRVAELPEQPPDVPVDRLGPDPLPRAEVAADEGRVDPRVG